MSTNDSCNKAAEVSSRNSIRTWKLSAAFIRLIIAFRVLTAHSRQIAAYSLQLYVIFSLYRFFYFHLLIEIHERYAVSRAMVRMGIDISRISSLWRSLAPLHKSLLEQRHVIFPKEGENKQTKINIWVIKLHRSTAWPLDMFLIQ